MCPTALTLSSTWNPRPTLPGRWVAAPTHQLCVGVGVIVHQVHLVALNHHACICGTNAARTDDAHRLVLGTAQSRRWLQVVTVADCDETVMRLVQTRAVPVMRMRFSRGHNLGQGSALSPCRRICTAADVYTDLQQVANEQGRQPPLVLPGPHELITLHHTPGCCQGQSRGQLCSCFCQYTCEASYTQAGRQLVGDAQYGCWN
jgi:hypothetical protein